jgi:hypothetical protein
LDPVAPLNVLSAATGTDDPPPHAESNATARLMLKAARLNSKSRIFRASLLVPSEDDDSIALCFPAAPHAGLDRAWLDVR